MPRLARRVLRAGFDLLVDHRAGEDFRVVPVTPPGSACSIAIMHNADKAGSVEGLHVVVTDLDAARAELVGRGLEATEIFHFGPEGKQPGPDPQHNDYNSFISFTNPARRSGWCRRSAAPERAADPPPRPAIEVLPVTGP